MIGFVGLIRKDVKMRYISKSVRVSWIWFTEFTLHEDDTVTIHRYDRGHIYEKRGWRPEDEGKEVSGEGCLIEDPNSERIVKTLRWNNKEYPVRNQQHIFSYKGE